jgi:hypothetical protein
VVAFSDVLAEHAVIDPRQPSILPGRQQRKPAPGQATS